MPPLNPNQTVPNEQNQEKTNLPPVLPSSPHQPFDLKNHKKSIIISISSIILIGILVWAGFKIIPSLSKSPDLCSTYFKVCVENKTNKWKVVSDTLHDFDLSNESEDVMIFLMSSQGMEFKDTDAGFTTVSLLGQNKQAYKDTKNGLTRVITGINNDKDSLIILLASEKDISMEKTKEIISFIKLKTTK
ncbi:MAG: hypothetical protein NTZ87_00930 [Candidatus Nomurabacteria bacterium]|nr:hypothetical protein [Candidatus Nomurabacteria bacterium]